MQELPRALAALAAYRQFIVCQFVPRPNGKTDKLPVNPQTLEVANAHDPAIWTDAATALAVTYRLGPAYGVGFVFTKHDPFWFTDIDHCLVGGDWSDVAKGLCARLAGAAVEVSHSGEGLHIIGTGTVPAHSCDNKAIGTQFYTSGRFVALTGTGAVGDAGADLTAAIGSVVAEYFPPTEAAEPDAWTVAPVPEWNGPADDAELIQKALASGSAAAAFGGRASFADLWEARADVLGAQWPDDHGNRAWDASAADMALAQHLAFWTGNDCQRIERLMWQSGLVRDKWRDRPDYVPRTIMRAVSRQRTFYGQAQETSDPGGVEIETGARFLPVQQQPEHFAGCVYVQDLHRVLTPGGALLRSEQFRAVYGGYIFGLDAQMDKTTKNAWEAFTESQAIRYPMADSICFRPQLPPGAIINEEGRRLVNTYVPIDTPRKPGDPAPFLDYLARLLPDERDRTIVLSYMAACIQYPGIKFQWCLLFQGTPGNGKTLLSRCVAIAIGRRYCHFPKSADIDNRFNGWIVAKMFIAVEDIYVPDHKLEVIETLKPMITGGDGLEIQFKGQDQMTADVCANFILNTNHRDAIQKTRDDRRFCVFFTAQQSVDDLARDGMNGDYFPDLYDWLKGEGRYSHLGANHGYAIVHDYLANYAIPDEFNPATKCHRAPDTSTTSEAIQASMNPAEQIVTEAVELGEQGFRGDMICTRAAMSLLQSHGKRLSPQRVSQLLQSLGYVRHPALGSAAGKVRVGGEIRRLYVRRGSLAEQLRTADAVADAWARANGAMTVGEIFQQRGG